MAGYFKGRNVIAAGVQRMMQDLHCEVTVSSFQQMWLKPSPGSCRGLASWKMCEKVVEDVIAEEDMCLMGMIYGFLYCWSNAA